MTRFLSPPTSLTRRTALTAAGSLGLLAAGTRPGAAEDRVLKIGSILALSGPNASIGKESLDGAQFAVKTLNADGVTVGGQAYRVELVNFDDESRAERSAAGAERLIGQDNVPVVLMPASSTTTLAALPIINKNRRIALSFVAAAPAVTAPEYKYSFRTTLTSIMNVAPSVSYIIKERGAKTIAYIGRNDDWGRDAARALKETAAQLGAKITVEEYFEPGSTDFYGLLTKVRATAPDAMIGAAFTEDGLSMIKQFRELQMKPTFLSVSVIWSSPVFLRAAGSALDGVYIATGPSTGDSPELRAFKTNYLKTTGGEALPYNTTAYDNVRLIVEAMKAAGTTDPDKVAETLKTFSFKGLLQTYKFDGGQQSEVVINVNEVNKGQVTVISSLLTK